MDVDGQVDREHVTQIVAAGGSWPLLFEAENLAAGIAGAGHPALAGLRSPRAQPKHFGGDSDAHFAVRLHRDQQVLLPHA